MWKPDDELHIVYDSGPQDLFDYRKIALTLTLRKLIRLDRVEEGLDESCHEPRDTVPRGVLVMRLAEVLGDHSWRTGSIGGGRLKQAEQQQPSKTVTLPTPAHHCCTQSHACTWHQWVNPGENRCVWVGRGGPLKAQNPHDTLETRPKKMISAITESWWSRTMTHWTESQEERLQLKVNGKRQNVTVGLL